LDTRRQHLGKSFQLPGRISLETAQDFDLADVFPYGQSNRQPNL